MDELGEMYQQTVTEVIAEKIAALEDAAEKRNTFLLVGHSYDKTIADMKTEAWP